MEQLIVRLGSNEDDVIHWIVCSPQDDDVIASGELPDAGHLSSLVDRAGQRLIIALVPTSDVLLKWVTLPAKGGRKALSAIPFMLEDEISGDIATQFFALGGRKNNQQAVAVVSKLRLRAWQSQLADAGLHCERILPDILAVPEPVEGWAALELGEQLLIRQDQWAGIQGEKNWLIQAINHHAKPLITPLILDNYSSLTAQDLNNVTVQQQRVDMPMKILADGLQSTQFNLLQGEFKSRKKQGGNFRKWRLAAVLAGIALCTTLIDKVALQQQLSGEKAALSQQIKEEFQRAFPSAGAYRDVRATMRSKMAALEQGAGSSSMLVMMNQLSEAFAKSQVKPASVKFDSARRELRMQAMAANFESLEQFKRLAEAQGFEVEQGAINNRNDLVYGSLVVRS
ncbi:type II secretion system protein GspL [Paraglaciecola polaris]|uniref:Type II secretion system protein L n=1 Tax=Paraglaciecola polaris LMG 21857 TaxID=1129793 RepID=K6ZYP5_9ALTE|nr:type II secretion system protein GspL [Paraglaciecola polaris]GAC35302.1 general secretion pathway protein L [Paraglaciecola polaris LMG 21857]|tara:strand:- start:34561 stop:35754 length:1194 start_codon:yes stop_codon:yes gene_type:complete